MRATLIVHRIAAVLLLSAACSCESPSGVADPTLTVLDVPGDALPAADLTRTYRHRSASVDADSMVRVLLRAGFRLSEAWQPLEDLCADPIGPRFTAVLAAADTRIERLGFERGTGIRACTRLVRRYVPR